MPERKTASDWIRQIQEEIEPDFRSDGYTRIYGDHARNKPSHIDDSPTAFAPVSEFIRIQLANLWIDQTFWKSVHQNDSATKLSDHIGERHSLRLPQIPAAIWAEIGRTPERREEITAAIANQPWRLVTKSSGAYTGMVLEEIARSHFLEIVRSYVLQPSVTHSEKLMKAFPKPEILKALQMFGSQMQQDAKLCLQKIDTGEAAQEARQNRGRPQDPERPKMIEQYVEKLKQCPSATDTELGLDEQGQKDDTQRDWVSIARNILEYREGIQVTRHVDDKGRGKKPKRKSPTK